MAGHEIIDEDQCLLKNKEKRDLHNPPLSLSLKFLLCPSNMTGLLKFEMGLWLIIIEFWSNDNFKSHFIIERTQEELVKSLY
jgi:hypothetical protein